MPEEHLPIAVVGAGFAGIGLAIKLEEAGITDFTILERAGSLGGTWRDNTYPGCACDVASQLYSYSFAPNPDWKRAFSRQQEILSYLEGVADDHGVERYIRYDTEVLEARWSEERRLWELDTTTGKLTADVFVSATGPFGAPVIPALPGLDRFTGTSFHSFHWDHGHDLDNERVAVIGTGASAVQFIPQIARDVEHLTVFQRTPPWVLPRGDRVTSPIERALMRYVPPVRLATRAGLYTMVESLGLAIFVDRRFRHVFESLGRLQLRRQVPDPALRAKLTPDYAIGCKRAVLSDNYYPALTRHNVRVETSGIEEIRERSIITADGAEHEVDTIIFGTGFDVPPLTGHRVKGRDGLSVIDNYRERPRSYLGTAISGFPNFFILLGPFAGAGNQSALFTLEAQMTYVVDAVRVMRERDLAVIDVREDVQEEFVSEMERRSADTVWLNGGCKSYYTTDDGRNAGLWPGFTFQFRDRTKQFDPEAYELEAA